MELVYVWIEEYKNIIKQGFNFSPRFRCEFTPEYDSSKDIVGGELVVKENEDYIPNFFGENINVTAIIGKNGSGKSSLSYSLYSIFKKSFDLKYILVYIKDDILFYSSNLKIDANINEKEINSNIFLYSYESICNESDKSNDIISLKKEKLLKYIFYSTFNRNFEISTFMYFPEKIEIESLDIEAKFRKILNDYLESYIYDNSIDYSDNTRLMYAQKDIVNYLKNSINNEYHMFLIILLIGENSDYLDEGLSDIEEVKSLLDKCDIKYLDENDFNRYILNVSHGKVENLSNIEKREKEILLKYSFLYEFDFWDKKDRNYNDLSHGEKTIYGQFISLYYLSNDSYRKNYIFLLDEPEISLHPNWQKKYVYELQRLLKQIQHKSFHILLFSHSPFILSDIPKQNIIFLDTYEDGTCKVVDGLKDKKETFGANIHTLLSDSFFMDDGLMGEFAKHKINEVIKLLNREELNQEDLKYCEQIISIIGEPIVKIQLQKMVDSKRLKKVDKIDEIEKKIQELQEELRKINRGES